MRIIAVVCILIGILIPTLVIYVDQQDSPVVRVEILSIEDVDLPIPTAPIAPLQNKSQVEAFMLEDTTNQNPYTDTYKCGNFANDVVVNATAKGIEAKVIVVLWVGNYTPHAIVLFPTAEGDIYVDATSGDWWVNFGLREGEYNSYSMTCSSCYGFKDKTVEMYGIKEKGYTNWVYVRTIPTPTPLPTPTPNPTIMPTPYHPCSTCNGSIVEEWTNIIKPTGLMTYYRCSTGQPLRNRDEVYQFMQFDQTDKNPFIMGNYVCVDFAQDVIHNSAVYGINCGIGVVYFTNGVCHSFIVFPTIDDGDVWVDPTAGDWWIYTTEQGDWKGVNMLDANWLYHGESRTILYIERITY